MVSVGSPVINFVHRRPDVIDVVLDRGQRFVTSSVRWRHSGVWFLSPLRSMHSWRSSLSASVSSPTSNRLQLNSDKTEVLWCTTGGRQHQLPGARRLWDVVRTFKFMHGIAPEYLGAVVCVADLPGRQSLRSAGTNRLLPGDATVYTVNNWHSSFPGGQSSRLE